MPSAVSHGVGAALVCLALVATACASDEPGVDVSAVVVPIDAPAPDPTIPTEVQAEAGAAPIVEEPDEVVAGAREPSDEPLDPDSAEYQALMDELEAAPTGWVVESPRDGVFAVERDPSWKVEPDSTVDELISVASSSMGPTDDLMAVLKRFAPIEIETFTLPEAHVFRISLELDDYRVGDPELTTLLSVSYVTTASREDAALTLATEFARNGLEPEQSETVDGDIVASKIYVRAPLIPQIPSLRVEIVDRVEGGSIVELRYTIRDQDRSALAVAHAWYGRLPMPTGTEPTNFSLSASPTTTGNHHIQVWSSSRPTGAVDAAAEVAELIETLREGGYDVDLDDPSFLRTNLANGVADISINGDANDVRVAIRYKTLVVAETPPLPATPGLGLAESADTAGVASALVFAEPNGPAIEPTMSPLEIERQLTMLLDSTDDVGSTVARVGRFPDGLPTMPDARLTRLVVRSELGWRDVPDHNVTVDYLTTASLEDAVLAHQTQLVAAGWTQADNQRDDTEDGLVATLSFEYLAEQEAVTATLAMTIEQALGVTTVSVQFRDETQTLVEDLERYSGWLAAAPIPDGGRRTETRMSVEQTDSFKAFVSLAVTDLYSDPDTNTNVDMTAEELRELVIAGLDTSSTWSFDRVNSDGPSSQISATFDGGNHCCVKFDTTKSTPASNLELTSKYFNLVLWGPADAPYPSLAAEASLERAYNAEPDWFELISVLSTSMGPTDDLNAVFGRLRPLGVDLFTLPASNIIGVEWDLRRAPDTAAPEVEERLRVSLVTSADRDDVAVTLATELAAAGRELRQAEQIDDGIVTSTIETSNETSNTISFAVVDRLEGGAIVHIEYREITADLERLFVADEWHRPSPLPDNAVLDSFSARVGPSVSGNHAIDLSSTFVIDDNTVDIDAVYDSVLAELEPNGYFAGAVEGDRIRTTLNQQPTEILFVRGVASTDAHLVIEIDQLTILSTENPPPPATAGVDPDADN